MATTGYLAMTGAEIGKSPALPERLAWMACHFSLWDGGLSNLPGQLPEGSLLILDDSIPLRGHDPERILAQLDGCIRDLRCSALLLDFQREGNADAADLAALLVRRLNIPVAVSEIYAAGLDSPVFASPTPPSVSLKSHLAKWAGRRIFLELALDGEQILLTEEGSRFSPLPRYVPQPGGHYDSTLCCHYSIAQAAEGIRFTLWRTREDIAAMLISSDVPITATVGLWQELGA